MEIKIVDAEKGMASSRQHQISPLASANKGATHDSFLTPHNARSGGHHFQNELMQRSLDLDGPMNIMENNYNQHQAPLEGAHHLEGQSQFGASSNAGIVSQPYLNLSNQQAEGDNFEVTNQRGFVIRGLKPVKTPIKYH